MDWLGILQTILIFALPTILTFIFGRLGWERTQVLKRQEGIEQVAEGVLAAAGMFGDGKGKEKLNYVWTTFRNSLVKAGYFTDAQQKSAIEAEYNRLKLNYGTSSLSKSLGAS